MGLCGWVCVRACACVCVCARVCLLETENERERQREIRKDGERWRDRERERESRLTFPVRYGLAEIIAPCQQCSEKPPLSSSHLSRPQTAKLIHTTLCPLQQRNKKTRTTPAYSRFYLSR